MNIFIALLAGALFGAGLTVAQMVNPQKVLNFLDLAAMSTGKWDPTLLFVFIGALPTMFIAYRLQTMMAKPAYEIDFRIPKLNAVDLPLVAGSVIFGIGWGLGGICPGPSITAFPLAGPMLTNLAIFVAAMMAGIALALMLKSFSAKRANA
ncbi:MAG: YeeE/YedE family protein [Hyphomicrobiaceae bacterium]|nr:YeeE/YedE family protein [Hyphomicrobiaceae bacterium]